MLCAVNRTCAAVSYNDLTKTCYMSGVPEVSYTPESEPNALVKTSFVAKLLVAEGEQVYRHLIILTR